MQYKTIRQAASAEYIVKRSRFIGQICPVQTAQEAADFLAAQKTAHWNAAHNVHAYVLREGRLQRCSDDGEPQGTAGIPVLDVLRREGVTDCIVVVTRYFGGILLGAGGLVRAYAHSAKLALDAGGIVTMALCSVREVRCAYDFYGRLAALIPEQGGVVEDVDYGDAVTLRFRIPKPLAETLEAALVDASLGKYHSEPRGEIYAEI